MQLRSEADTNNIKPSIVNICYSTKPTTESSSSMATLITLNVGGTVYKTTKETIQGADVNSLLRKILDPPSLIRDRDNRVLELDSNTFFFDRDGVMFRYILHYLRCGPVSLPEDLRELNMLNTEADFFGLHDLKQKIMMKK